MPQVLLQLGLDTDLALPMTNHILLSMAFLLLPGCLALGMHELTGVADFVSAQVSGVSLLHVHIPRHYSHYAKPCTMELMSPG